MHFFTLFTALLGCLLAPFAYAQLTSAVIRPGLLINDTASGVTTTAGGLGFSDAGFGFVTEARELSASVPTMPAFTVPALRTVESVSVAASSWVAANESAFRTQLANFMRTYGLSSVWYIYERPVTITAAGSNSNQKLTWALFQDSEGRASYGEPRLEPTDASDVRILQVRYWVQRLPEGLASQPNPYGGYLQWQVLNSALSSMSGPDTSGTVFVNGAFDPPNPSHDDQTGVNCLLDASRAGCPGASIDVKRLLSSTGAVLAFVDYTYGIEPKYQARTDSLCPGGAGTCQVPVTTYRFTSRRLTYDNCGDTARYTNIGTYSYELERITDRFVVDSQLSRNSLQRFVEDLTSYQIPFSPQLNLTGSQAAILTPVTTPTVINPVSETALISAYQLSGTIAELAPVVVDGELTCPPVTIAVSPTVHNVATTGTFSASAAGGKGPYTFYWRPIADYAGGTIHIESPYSASTRISRTGPTLGPSGGTVGIVEVIVTDSRGTTASAQISLTIDPDLPLTVEVDPSQVVWSNTYGVYGIVANCYSPDSNCNAVTAPAPVIVRGGTGQYTATWTYLAGTPATPVNATSYKTTFSRAGSMGEDEGLYVLNVNDGRESVSMQLAVITRHGCSTMPPSFAPRPVSFWTTVARYLQAVWRVEYCERILGYTHEVWMNYDHTGWEPRANLTLAPYMDPMHPELETWTISYVWLDPRAHSHAVWKVRACKDGVCGPFSEEVTIVNPCPGHNFCVTPSKYTPSWAD